MCAPEGIHQLATALLEKVARVQAVKHLEEGVCSGHEKSEESLTVTREAHQEQQSKVGE